MVQQSNLLHKKPAKPSNLPLFIAVFAAFVLTAFLINSLFHKNKSNYAKKTLSLPKLMLQKNEKNAVANNNGMTLIKTRSGDTLASVFKRASLSRQTLQAVLNKNPQAKLLAHIKPNQEIQLFIHQQTLEKMIIPTSPTQFLVVLRQGKGYSSKIQSRKMTSQNNYITATVRGSLYGTAKRMNIPSKLIRQMTEIFNWEIDFAREIRAGDQFSIVYKAYYIEDKLVNVGDILAVSYTNRDAVHQAIRHVNAAGDYDYFTPKGTSLKKAFSRYPVKFSHISSTYSLSRYHPILKYRRPHKGVDLAASIGTPVYATGDGRVDIIDRHNGYGNMIKIVHSKQYSSIYAHLLRFRKGLARGDKVKRGQVIGYVGQTGLADGPHCHYEFHVNHQPRNPSTVDLPRASPVSRREMASFKSKANTLLAQLKLYETASLAAAEKKSGAKG